MSLDHSDRESPFLWSTLSDRWLRITGHLLTSSVEANRAVMTAFGYPNSSTSGPDRGAPSVPEVAYRSPDWTVERSVEMRGNIGIGDSVTFTKPIIDEDVRAFAQISGDTNRLHLDTEFAEETRFKGRIVHGTLISGLISAALARFPGQTIYLSQNLEFHRPVQIGETLTSVCEVIENLGDDRYRLTTSVYNADGEVVIDGEAVVLIDPLPETDAP